MNRNELAKEMDVSPCDVDNWLLRGCPARKTRREWEFEIEPVKFWLNNEKISIRRINHRALRKKPSFDRRWFGGRCPICADRGFSGEKAGRLYNFGGVFEKKLLLRRVGIPCGHSQEVNIPTAMRQSPKTPRIQVK
jgi:hypothetical protein